MSAGAAAPFAKRQIKVWLCGHAFVDHTIHDEDEAAEFEQAMRRRFFGCRVTNTPHDTSASLAPKAALSGEDRHAARHTM
jgi:hypothetical protein